MIVNVFMLAFQSEVAVRSVEIPDGQKKSIGHLLEDVFHYGQNDIQNVPNICSVSAGDVIVYNDKLYYICSGGFASMTLQDFSEYVKLSRMERHRHVMRHMNGDDSLWEQPVN